VDDATVAAHRLTMRVAVERQAQDGSLTGLGAGIAGLLLVVTRALDQPWRNRAARDAIQQIMALHEHLAPYLGERDDALTETLLGCAAGRSGTWTSSATVSPRRSNTARTWSLTASRSWAIPTPTP
jgi:hypothetical protein